MFIHRLNNFVNLGLLVILVAVVGNASAEVQSNQNAINFVQIQEFANFSNGAYQVESKIRKQDFSKNYTFTHYSSIPAIEIAYYLKTDDVAKTQIIAVRGTSNIENAIIDVALKLKQDKHAGVRLHDGFSYAAQAIYAEIKPKLKPDYVISTTGHSLGGAVALILAMYLDVEDYKTGNIVTFGQPKVTNIAGATKFQHLNVTRVVTPKDLVPLVPPLDPMDINNLDIYWHLGKEVVLLQGDTYALLEGVGSMMRATKFTQESINENNLKNHQMTLYLEMIKRKISSARLVPFKHSFNLFNLFGGEGK